MDIKSYYNTISRLLYSVDLIAYFFFFFHLIDNLDNVDYVKCLIMFAKLLYIDVSTFNMLHVRRFHINISKTLRNL
jgi:hypothetical protein